MVGSQKVRMRVKPTMDEDYLDEHAFVLRTIDRDGNGQWSNNKALTLFVHLFYLARASEYDVCEIIRWQLYRQGFSAARVILYVRDNAGRSEGHFWTELQWQCQSVTLEEIIDSLAGDNTYMFMCSRSARWMSNPSETDHDTASGR